jgi:hypothetical protein
MAMLHPQTNLQRARAMTATAESIAQGHSAVFGVTQFSDYSPQEMRMLAGSRVGTGADSSGATDFCQSSPVNCNNLPNVTVPAAFDW